MCHTDDDSFEGVAAVKYTGSDVTEKDPLPVSCDVRSSLTRASIVLDADWVNLTPAQRVAVVRRFTQHAQLPVSFISLLPTNDAVDVGQYSEQCL